MGTSRPRPSKLPHRTPRSVHLQRRVADALRERIETGTLPRGSRLPPLRTTAREFGVSTMTVCKAIELLEREACIHRIPQLGAFVGPVPGGRSAATATQKLVALAAADLGGIFNMAVARGIGKACRAHGWTLQIYDAHLDFDMEAGNLLRIFESGLRGVIVMTFGRSEHVAAVIELQLAGFPVVLVDQIPPTVQADLVESDHEGGAYRGVKYLLDHGHDCVVMLSHPPESSSIAARVRGYEKALREAGLEPRPEWRVWTDQAVHLAGSRENRPWRGGCEAILPLLRNARPPIAVLAIDAYTQWGVYKACAELGLRIPQDVSVVGFDDSEVAHAIDPPMTIIAQRTDEIGRAAVELLERQIAAAANGQTPRQTYAHVIIDVDLVERRSVARVSGGGHVTIPAVGG